MCVCGQRDLTAVRVKWYKDHSTSEWLGDQNALDQLMAAPYHWGRPSVNLGTLLVFADFTQALKVATKYVWSGYIDMHVVSTGRLDWTLVPYLLPLEQVFSHPTPTSYHMSLKLCRMALYNFPHQPHIICP